MSINYIDFKYIRQLLNQKTSVILPYDKVYFVESRLAPIASSENLNSVSQLITKLRNNPLNDLHKRVIEALMTTETSFFRDNYPFEALQKFILPELISKQKMKSSLSIWSSACSSGQEPYSIAILLQEYFPVINNWNVSIIASDISEQMLELARIGRYNQHQVERGLSVYFQNKYFQRQGKEWQIIPEICRKVVFRQLNLCKKWNNLPKMDLIFLRNVLIYFNIETKRNILFKVRQLLKRDGYLFLGGGETTINIDDNFELVRFNRAICYRLRKK
ncbi:MAG: protein-glutamate O-methyltransferase CheR [Trichodesmium sp. St16_bin4-tuft]|nr:protein-glutamate O-methyltransferase CheR [Trichodesmium sp. St4_bin8_1]MDE5071267.1 protein-glutamate O-methyltransferase CheR [Trichodesmium sp. St5_bin8]MDE5099291.1 protein-glutamate O-methyltransferase CheR [Trichodesmium sp. St16_bin4-tuft]MDE5104530.1 protein-glutamate O-methyltransferase CheR [Trichodesmium sp. St19_bin2]